ncbi:MAG: inosine/xanthosine triphosphatase [Gemmatimonadaceae bacterium]|jgi:inosine/xanthosine triphosphatase|nr:inosine/xanthosine triphosphatase [Gemmatimonadaceae bacterium]
MPIRETDPLRPLRVVVGSTNPVKLAATRAVLARVVPHLVVEGRAVDSGVPAQPWGDSETIAGARARAQGALALEPDAELGVGLEGGVVAEGDGQVRSCAWCVVVDGAGREGTGGSLAMPLPPAAASRLRAGEELGHVMDQLAGITGTKHGPGAVGLLTRGLIDRQGAYEMLVTYALAPWLADAYWALPAGDQRARGR